MRALVADFAMRSLTAGGLGNRMDALVPMGEGGARRDALAPMRADVDVALAGPGEPLRWGA